MLNLKRLLIFAFALTTLVPSQAGAISPIDRKAVIYDTVWFDNTTTGCSITNPTELSGSDNVEIAYNYFVHPERGFTPEQAAGMIGNMLLESGMDPASHQNGGGPGRGIAQWTVNERWVGLIGVQNKRNLPSPFDLGLQLDYIMIEFNGGEPAAGRYDGSEKAAYNHLKTTRTVEEATRSFLTKFERANPAKAHFDKRLQYANEVFAKHGGSTSGGVSLQVPGGCNSVTGTGENTQFIDGFTVYSQFDPAWANKPYGSSTIAESGCGPAAMAMIVTALKGSPVTPDVVATYAASRGMYVPGAGSSWQIGTVVAEHYGLKSTHIGADVAKITAFLQAGGLVIAAGQGAKPYTGGGHIIVIRGVTADGKWKIGDSGHRDTSAQDWDPQFILSMTRDGSVYGITR